MTELFDLVRDMLLLAVTLLVPLVLAAAAGAVVGGLAVVYLGLQDQTLAAMVRGAAVVLAIVATGAAGFDHVAEFTRDSWSSLARVGQDGVAVGSNGP